MRGKSALLLTILLSGCAVGPDYHLPTFSLPSLWHNAPAKESVQKESAQVAITKDTPWWKEFHDPVLDQLIAKAATSSLDLQLADARIREARAAQSGSNAALYPSVTFDGAAARDQNTLGGFPYFKPFDDFRTRFDVSWEPDLFGGNRRQAEADTAELQGAEESRNSAWVSLLGEVARNYLEVRHYQNQIRITQDTLQAQEETLHLTQKEFDAGQSNKLDILRATSNLQNTSSQLPTYETALTTAQYRLEYLLGEAPGALDALLKVPQPVPVVHPELVLSAPAEAIAQRPDVRAAERELAAATAMQGVATAKLYPDISLTALLGFETGTASDLFNYSSKSWGIGAGILAPVLNFGKIEAGIDAADARQEQAFIHYKQTVLGALSEVESALKTYFKEEERRKMLADTVETNRESVALAHERYKEGFSSFLEVLDAERSLDASQSDLATAEAAVSTDLVHVYKALGGGWAVQQADAAKPKAE